MCHLQNAACAVHIYMHMHAYACIWLLYTLQFVTLVRLECASSGFVNMHGTNGEQVARLMKQRVVEVLSMPDFKAPARRIG